MNRAALPNAPAYSANATQLSFALAKYNSTAHTGEINMGQIRGYVELELTKTTGDIELITVDGSQFELQQGGNWSRDRDDDELYAGFLFIAFCDGFDLLLSVSIHGNSITDYDIRARENDLEEFEIKKVAIIEDELDTSNLFPCKDNDID